MIIVAAAVSSSFLLSFSSLSSKVKIMQTRILKLRTRKRLKVKEMWDAFEREETQENLEFWIRAHSCLTCVEMWDIIVLSIVEHLLDKLPKEKKK